MKPAYFRIFVFVICFGLAVTTVWAQSGALPLQEKAPVEEKAPREIVDSLSAAENVSLDFKDADIHNVLKIIAHKAGVNIVPTADVMGTISIKLTDVPWDRALDIILKTNGYGFQRQGNVIFVTKIENLAKIQSEEPLRTEVVHLKFLDAQDAQRILVPMLSARGKIAILYSRGQKGWKFGSFKIGRTTVDARMQQREAEEKIKSEMISVEKNTAGQPVITRIDYEPAIKSKTLLITDTDASLDRITQVLLPEIDRMPKQVLVEAKFIEVNRDRLKDIGFDYGTGTTGATGTVGGFSHATSAERGDTVLNTVGGALLGSQTTPSIFSPKAGSALTGIEPYSAGLELVFRKLTGTEFEVVLHALEEDVGANTLSAPKIVTLDNQEASMLVGYHQPILSSSVSEDEDSTTMTQTLDYYQEIGIRLNVVPQVSEDGYINMIVHPSITSSSSNEVARSISGNATVTSNYPIIDVREAQTQVLMRDGETVVIGGLLKDVKSKSIIGVPFLSKIPLIGAFFRRETVDTAKVDLLIFITAHIIKEDDFSAEEIAKLQTRLERPPEREKKAKALKKETKKEKRVKKAKKAEKRQTPVEPAPVMLVPDADPVPVEQTVTEVSQSLPIGGTLPEGEEPVVFGNEEPVK